MAIGLAGNLTTRSRVRKNYMKHIKLLVEETNVHPFRNKRNIFKTNWGYSSKKKDFKHLKP